MSISSERIASIEAKKNDLSEALAAPGLTPDEFVRLSKDYAAIEPVAAAAREVRRLRAELQVLTGLADDGSAEAELREMAVAEAEDIRRRARRCSKCAPGPVATRRPCSRATCCGCISAFPRNRAGGSN
jgi:protein subunit release factor A